MKLETYKLKERSTQEEYKRLIQKLYNMKQTIEQTFTRDITEIDDKIRTLEYCRIILNLER